MPVIDDRFQGRVGPVGNGWTEAVGELRIHTEGKLEFVHGDHNRFEGRTYEEPTAGQGWQNKDAGEFPHAAWKGARLLGGIRYSYEAGGFSLGRLARDDSEVISYEQAFAEWEVNGATYGRRANSTGSSPANYRISLLGADIPADVTGERFIRLIAADGTTLIDRFRYPELPLQTIPFFDGSGFAGVMREFRADRTTGLWDVTVTGRCEGVQYDNWGSMVLIIGADAVVEGDHGQGGAQNYIYLSFDVGGYLGVSYLNALGQDVLQGNTNTNGVEDNAFAYQGYSYPDEQPEIEWSYRMTVDPNTGVVAVYVNGVFRGDVVIPEAEIARYKQDYEAGRVRFMGFGLHPFIFQEVRRTFYFTRFQGTVPNPPGAIDKGGRDANFVAPIF